MTGPFRIHLPKHLTTLDQAALPAAVRDVLFNGIAFDAAVHVLRRLPVAVLDDPSFKGSANLRRRKSYARVDQLFVQVAVRGEDLELLAAYPRTTLAPGLVDPQLEIGLAIEPTTGRFSLSGTLKNLLRRKRHWIIHTHTAQIAQWAFQKDYLRDNFLFELDLLFRTKPGGTGSETLVCEVRAQDGGRLVRSTRKSVALTES